MVHFILHPVCTIFAGNAKTGCIKILGKRDFLVFFSKEKETLDKGLSKTKESVFGKIARAVAGKSKLMMKYWIIWKRC